MRGKEWSVPIEQEKLQYWINSEGLNQEIWAGIVEIYSSVFANGKELQEKPDFKKLSRLRTPTGGEKTFYPLESKNYPLEVRTKVSGHEVFFKFVAYISGPTKYPEKRNEFQDKTEKYLKDQGLKLVPYREIC
jgi:hypothetical protein